jgi:butyryl-CoA:acetate CoA-transferase
MPYNIMKEVIMGYAEEYQKKLVSADEAVKAVHSGDWIDYGWCNGTADALDKALAKRTDELKDVNVRGGILLKTPAIFEREDAGEHFTWNSWHMSGIERKLINRGCAYYAPIRYSELPRYYRDPHTKKNAVAMFQVTPMDKHGFFNFGPNASHLAAVVETSATVIVEVNENMPRCLGGTENGVHISDVDFIVEGSNPPIAEMGAGGPASEVDKAVAKLIVNEIPDGACLQLGIGGMPNAVGSLIAESDLKDLGVHTEMYVDAFVDIAKAGKINGSRKNIDRFRQAFAFGCGTKKMYDYLDENPEIMSAPVSYTNDIRSISALDNFMSINNAVDIDLFGQVNAESAGTKHISGAGGQLDFVLGAYLSKGGKSFICCSSTYKTKDGQVKSRILPTLNTGSIVTDTRANTHYLVTEFGIVNVKGLSTWEKAEAIISIAHPDFREELIAEAEKMKIWRRSNK